MNLFQSFFALRALRNHIPEGPFISIRYVDDFDHILQNLNKIVPDVDWIVDYKVPRERELGVIYGRSSDEEERIENGFLLSKLDSAILYLGALLTEEERKIGFNLQV